MADFPVLLIAELFIVNHSFRPLVAIKVNLPSRWVGSVFRMQIKV